MVCKPAYIDTIEFYDTDLRWVPLLLEADFLSGFIQKEFFNDPPHFSEVETPAIIKILMESRPEYHGHWSILYHGRQPPAPVMSIMDNQSSGRSWITNRS
jgi:hypothetical protein